MREQRTPEADAPPALGSGGMLRRLLLVRAGRTLAHERGQLVGAADPPLSERGRAEVEALRRHWEWADFVCASPSRRARESAAILAPNVRIELEPAFGPTSYGSWQGLDPEAIRARDPIAWADHEAGISPAPPDGEPAEALRARVAKGLARLLALARLSPLVVSHAEVIREVAWRLAHVRLPLGRPDPAEMLLLTRAPSGAFRLGRASSDPDPLRSPLEREGLSSGEDPLPERHIGHLELRP
ncbi:MAG TPA: histidine phosphatase family protein [Myxococcota bacterium]|nr:histidine phosphatase family protein [Myxococcota bacterium]